MFPAEGLDLMGKERCLLALLPAVAEGIVACEYAVDTAVGNAPADAEKQSARAMLIDGSTAFTLPALSSMSTVRVLLPPLPTVFVCDDARLSAGLCACGVWGWLRWAWWACAACAWA
ncbi:hypothetical protein BDR26DRAFT_881019 [Obelidium mucronatum]|nr:hypothetical protein BDR26DRAFT_881019 [Obelidium mucronatum]